MDKENKGRVTNGTTPQGDAQTKDKQPLSQLENRAKKSNTKS
ncbi:small, acid-soluble spore protein L [Bacillus sp. 28A-2]|nr:small, acid-soluble spore protein L [Bacillus sp. 28A-2]